MRKIYIKRKTVLLNSVSLNTETCWLLKKEITVRGGDAKRWKCRSHSSTRRCCSGCKETAESPGFLVCEPVLRLYLCTPQISSQTTSHYLCCHSCCTYKEPELRGDQPWLRVTQQAGEGQGQISVLSLPSCLPRLLPVWQDCLDTPRRQVRWLERSRAQCEEPLKGARGVQPRVQWPWTLSPPLPAPGLAITPGSCLLKI